jgi:hypothetical protein
MKVRVGLLPAKLKSGFPTGAAVFSVAIIIPKVLSVVLYVYCDQVQGVVRFMSYEYCALFL